MTSNRRFFLLDEPLPGTEIPSMMGRVVSDKRLPLFKYAPFEPLSSAPAAAAAAAAPGSESEPRPAPEARHNTNDLIPDILPAPSRTADVTTFLEAVRNRSLHASLASLLSLAAGQSDEQHVRLQAREVRRYSLTKVDRVFKALMKHAPYAQDVRDLLGSAPFGKAYFVVGFLTAAAGARWSRSSGNATRIGADVAVPVAALAGGVPLPAGTPLDVGAGYAVAGAGASGQTGIAADEEIFAVAYAVVRTSYTVGLHGIARTEVVGPPKRAKARHLAFGGGDREAEDRSDSDSDSDCEDEDKHENAPRGTRNEESIQQGSQPPEDDIFIDEAPPAITGMDAEKSFEVDFDSI